MKQKDKIIIPFVGLKNGVHEFSFNVDKAFLKQFEYSIIEDAKVQVSISFEKKENLFELDFDLNGTLISDCDRCAEPLEIKVNGSQHLIVKFSDEDFNESDEILSIPESAYELDLSDLVYEYTCVLMPSKKVHEKIEDCNPAVIEKLEELTNSKEKQESDPRWDALSKLK